MSCQVHRTGPRLFHLAMPLQLGTITTITIWVRERKVGTAKNGSGLALADPSHPVHPTSAAGRQKGGCELRQSPTVENWVSMRDSNKLTGCASCCRNSDPSVSGIGTLVCFVWGEDVSLLLLFSQYPAFRAWTHSHLCWHQVMHQHSLIYIGTGLNTYPTRFNIYAGSKSCINIVHLCWHRPQHISH